MAQSREAKLEKMRVQQRERYLRMKTENPEQLRAAQRDSKRRMQKRGVPPGAYKRYLGVELKGPPTRAQRVQLYAILDLLPPAPPRFPRSPQASAARQARMARPRARNQPSVLPALMYRPTIPDPPAPVGADPYLVARLLHDTAECECRICVEMRMAQYFRVV